MFLNATKGSNGSTPLCFEKTQDCHYFKLKKDTTNCSEPEGNDLITVQWICPKDPNFSQDSSRKGWRQQKVQEVRKSKIPARVFAVMYLLHRANGFSFGFWLLENRLAQEDEEQAFTDYWRSIITVVSMAFGLSEFKFDGPFDYNHKEDDYEGHINTIFAYILILLMVLLVLLGLLNLLLFSIIKDHKEMKASVAS